MAETNGTNGSKVTYAAVCGFIIGIAAWGLSQKFMAVEQRIDDGAIQRDKLDTRLSELVQKETDRNNRLEREMGEIRATLDSRLQMIAKLQDDNVRLWERTRAQDERINELRERVAGLEKGKQ